MKMTTISNQNYYTKNEANNTAQTTMSFLNSTNKATHIPVTSKYYLGKCCRNIAL